MILPIPISRFKLDGNSVDSVGGHNGTDSNITYVPGLLGDCAYFPNAFSTNMTVIGSKPVYSFIQNTKVFTINFLFKPVNYTQVSYVLSTCGTTNGFYVEFYSGDIYLFVAGNTSYYFQSASGALTDNNWTMISITSDETDVRFYKNGVLIGTAPAIVLTSSGDSVNNLSLSCFEGDGRNPPHYKDDITIFDSKISATELEFMWSKYSVGQDPFNYIKKSNSNFLTFFK